MSNTLSSTMRKIQTLLEASYDGPSTSPNVSYSHKETKGEITKVIATLSSYDSAKYTKLAQNLAKMKALQEQIDSLEAEVKDDAKSTIADLFHAKDEAYTRTVETVSFTLQLTKTPERTTVVKYAEVLGELQNHLTPELVKVLESIKQKYSSSIQKSAALSYSSKDKTKESMMNEGFWDDTKTFLKGYLAKITAWGERYDEKLNRLKSQAGMMEGLGEGDDYASGGANSIGSLVNIIHSALMDNYQDSGFSEPVMNSNHSSFTVRDANNQSYQISIVKI